MQVLVKDKLLGKKLCSRYLYVVFRDGRSYYNEVRTNIAIYYDIWDSRNQTVRIRSTAPRDIIEDLSVTVEQLKSYLVSRYSEDKSRGPIPKDWLRTAVDSFGKDSSESPETLCGVNDAFDSFLLDRNICHARVERYEVIRRMFLRFEQYNRLAVPGKESYRVDMARFSVEDLQAFHDYIFEEYKLVDSYPSILVAVPESSRPRARSRNTMHSLLSCTRSVFNFLEARGICTDNPFRNFTIEDEQYGTPFYLTLQELRKVYEYDFSSAPLVERQRDIFVFQCYVGARISDMMKFTEDNISDNILTYIPSKTHRYRAEAITVPLSDVALEIISRYSGAPDGRLMPFIHQQHYNEYIKDILRTVGIVRKVPVLNPATRVEEYFPICDVASSHMARRTFVGNLYSKVKDPNLIGSMSGHAPGSRSFLRYRSIDTEMQKELIDKLKFD